MKIEEVQEVIKRFSASLTGRKSEDIQTDSLVYRDFLNTLAYAGCFDAEHFNLILPMSRFATKVGSQINENTVLSKKLMNVTSAETESILQDLIKSQELTKEIDVIFGDDDTKDKSVLTIEEMLAKNFTSQMELTNFLILSTQSLLFNKKDIDQSPLLSSLNSILLSSPKRMNEFLQKIIEEVNAKDDDHKGLYYDMLCKEYTLPDTLSGTKPIVAVLGSVSNLVYSALEAVCKEKGLEESKFYMLSGNRPYDKGMDKIVLDTMKAIGEEKQEQILRTLEEDSSTRKQFNNIFQAVKDSAKEKDLTEADLMTGLMYLFSYNTKLEGLSNLETNKSSTGREHVNTEDTIKTLLKTIEGSLTEALVCAMGISLSAISQHKQIRNTLIEENDNHKLAIIAPSTQDLVKMYGGNEVGKNIILINFLQNFAGSLYADYPCLVEPKIFNKLQVSAGQCKKFDLIPEERDLFAQNMAKRRLVSSDAVRLYSEELLSKTVDKTPSKDAVKVTASNLHNVSVDPDSKGLRDEVRMALIPSAINLSSNNIPLPTNQYIADQVKKEINMTENLSKK